MLRGAELETLLLMLVTLAGVADVDRQLNLAMVGNDAMVMMMLVRMIMMTMTTMMVKVRMMAMTVTMMVMMRRRMMAMTMATMNDDDDDDDDDGDDDDDHRSDGGRWPSVVRCRAAGIGQWVAGSDEGRKSLQRYLQQLHDKNLASKHANLV